MQENSKAMDCHKVSTTNLKNASSTGTMENGYTNNGFIEDYTHQPDFDQDEYNVANEIQEAYLNTLDRNSKLRPPTADQLNDPEKGHFDKMKDSNDNINNINLPLDKKNIGGESSRRKCCRNFRCCIPAPSGRLARYLSLLFLCIFGYGNLWAILGKLALPNGYVYAMIVIVVLAWIGGELTKKIKLPPLLGMLIVGFILRNVPHINLGQYINPTWSTVLRNMALGIILTRAGMGLDITKLRKLGWVCLRMAILPCIAEIVGAAIGAHYFLAMPWDWAFMLGSVLSGLSPAVVVPGMLSIQQQGYGVDKGIPTLGVAAVSIDDALAVAAFGIVYGVTFAEGSLAMTIIQGPLEVLMGFAYGIIVGIICWYLPHGKATNVVLYRFLTMFLASIFAIFGSRAAGYGGAGAIGCLIFAFVAAHGWRKEGKGTEKEVSYIYSIVWLNFQPILFGLIGAEIMISNLDSNTVGLAIATMFLGILFRIIIAGVSLLKSGFNWKEQIYIQFTGLPKATVQAAVGPLALDTVRQLHLGAELEEYGVQLLTIAVLSILITAPIGAIALAVTPSKLLKKTNTAAEVDMSDFAE